MVAHPRLLVLYCDHPLGLRDEFIRQGCPLHHLFIFMSLPGDSQSEVHLQLASGEADITRHTPPSLAGATPDDISNTVSQQTSAKGWLKSLK